MVPDGPPSGWEEAADGDLLYWAFLDQVTDKPVRPRLVVEEAGSAIGPVRFAVPRLVPEAGWVDARDYRAWEEATWRGEVTRIPAVVTVEEAAARLPRAPTRPRWSEPSRLVSATVRADLRDMTSTEILREDGEEELAGEPARGVRLRIQRGRDLLAAIGALPWVVTEEAGRGGTRGRWWRQAALGPALRRWRSDATNLSWRRPREEGVVEHDPVREAAAFLQRAPWTSPGPREMALARTRVRGSAIAFEGSCAEWLESLLAYPHQSPQTRRDLVRRADEQGAADELRRVWDGSRGPIAG